MERYVIESYVIQSYVVENYVISEYSITASLCHANFRAIKPDSKD